MKVNTVCTYCLSTNLYLFYIHVCKITLIGLDSRPSPSMFVANTVISRLVEFEHNKGTS